MKIDNIKKPTEAEVEQKLRDYLKKKKMEISEAEIEDTVEYIISLFDDEWIAYSVKEGITDVDKAIREWYKDTVGLENWEKENGSLEGNPYVVDSSRKAIKSDLDDKQWVSFRDDIYNAITDVFAKYNMSGVPPFADEGDFKRVLGWMERHGFWEMDDEIDSGCHGKGKKKGKKEIKSSIDFKKISEMCDDLDFSVLDKYEYDEDDAFFVKLDAIGEGPNALEDVEIRFTENDDGENVIGVYKIGNRYDTMTTKHVVGDITKDDINEAVYQFLEENPQLLESSKKEIKSAAEGTSDIGYFLENTILEAFKRNLDEYEDDYDNKPKEKQFLLDCMDSVDNWIEVANRKFGK